MAFAFIQGKANGTGSSNNVTVTLTSALTAGNALLIGWNSTNTLSSISDGTNTYTIGSVTFASGGALFGHAYAFGIAAGSPTITLTFTGSTTGGQVWAEEWSGIATSNAYDGAAGLHTAGSGGSDNFNSGSFTPTTNGDLIWAYGQLGNGSGLTVGSGFAGAFSDIATSGYMSEFLTQSTAAAISPNFTCTGSFNENCFAAAFKAASGAVANPVIIGLASAEW